MPTDPNYVVIGPYDKDLIEQYAKDIVLLDRMLDKEMDKLDPLLMHKAGITNENTINYVEYLTNQLNVLDRNNTPIAREVILLLDSETKKVAVYVTINLDSDYIDNVWIRNFITDPEFRGKGYGGKMFAFIKNYVKTKYKKKSITLGTLDKNKGALKFYERQGFKPQYINLYTKIN